MSAAAAPTAVDLGPPEAIRTGPLALAAGAYWHHGSEAGHALWSLGWIRAIGPDLRRLLTSQAVEAIEGLRDLAETGHPAIRSRAAGRLAPLKSRLSALVEPRP